MDDRASIIDRLRQERDELARQLNMLRTLDEDLLAILGRPNFACCRTAAALRLGGHTIAERAEAEQAAVIHWLLHIYLSHGRQWRHEADRQLHAMIAPKPEADR